MFNPMTRDSYKPHDPSDGCSEGYNAVSSPLLTTASLHIASTLQLGQLTTHIPPIIHPFDQSYHKINLGPVKVTPLISLKPKQKERLDKLYRLYDSFKSSKRNRWKAKLLLNRCYDDDEYLLLRLLTFLLRTKWSNRKAAEQLDLYLDSVQKASSTIFGVSVEEMLSGCILTSGVVAFGGVDKEATRSIIVMPALHAITGSNHLLDTKAALYMASLGLNDQYSRGEQQQLFMVIDLAGASMRNNVDFSLFGEIMRTIDRVYPLAIKSLIIMDANSYFKTKIKKMGLPMPSPTYIKKRQICKKMRELFPIAELPVEYGGTRTDILCPEMIDVLCEIRPSEYTSGELDPNSLPDASKGIFGDSPMVLLHSGPSYAVGPFSEMTYGFVEKNGTLSTLERGDNLELRSYHVDPSHQRHQEENVMALMCLSYAASGQDDETATKGKVHFTNEENSPRRSPSASFTKQMMAAATTASALLIDLPPHPNVLVLKGAVFSPTFATMVFQYGHIQLRSLLEQTYKSGKVLPWTQTTRIAVEVAKGLHHLHEHGIILRTLSTRAIWLQRSSPSSSSSSASTCDYSNAQVGEAGLDGVLDALDVRGARTASLVWTAPELIDSNEAVLPAADVYSLGLVLVALVKGTDPFQSDTPAQAERSVHQAMEGSRPVIPRRTNKRYAQLIRSCWKPDPNQRPSLSKVLRTLNKIQSSASDDDGDSCLPYDARSSMYSDNGGGGGGLDDGDATSPKKEIEDFMDSLGLSEYTHLLHEEAVTMDSLVLLDSPDLQRLGLPLGPRTTLLAALGKATRHPQMSRLVASRRHNLGGKTLRSGARSPRRAVHGGSGSPRKQEAPVGTRIVRPSSVTTLKGAAVEHGRQEKARSTSIGAEKDASRGKSVASTSSEASPSASSPSPKGRSRASSRARPRLFDVLTHDSKHILGTLMGASSGLIHTSDGSRVRSNIDTATADGEASSSFTASSGSAEEAGGKSADGVQDLLRRWRRRSSSSAGSAVYDPASSDGYPSPRSAREAHSKLQAILQDTALSRKTRSDSSLSSNVEEDQKPSGPVDKLRGSRPSFEGVYGMLLSKEVPAEDIIAASEMQAQKNGGRAKKHIRQRDGMKRIISSEETGQVEDKKKKRKKKAKKKNAKEETTNHKHNAKGERKQEKKERRGRDKHKRGREAAIRRSPSPRIARPNRDGDLLSPTHHVVGDNEHVFTRSRRAKSTGDAKVRSPSMMEDYLAQIGRKDQNLAKLRVPLTKMRLPMASATSSPTTEGPSRSAIPPASPRAKSARPLRSTHGDTPTIKEIDGDDTDDNDDDDGNNSLLPIISPPVLKVPPTSTKQDEDRGGRDDGKSNVEIGIVSSSSSASSSSPSSSPLSSGVYGESVGESGESASSSIGVYGEMISSTSTVYGEVGSSSSGVYGETASSPSSIYGETASRPSGVYGDPVSRPSGVYGDPVSSAATSLVYGSVVGSQENLNQITPSSSATSSPHASDDEHEPIGKISGSFKGGESSVRYRKLSGKAGEVQERMRARETDFGIRRIHMPDVNMSPIPLAAGGFGTVYRGTWKGLPVAIKQLTNGVSSARKQQEFVQEALLMHHIGCHRNIVALYGVIVDDYEWFMVTELAERGSVYDALIRNQPVIPLELLLRVARDTAEGLAYLHANGVIHRDMAARNVLLSNNFQVLLTDFGLSRAMATDDQPYGLSASKVGPIKWMSPEAIRSQVYSPATDAWSYGVFLWEICTQAEKGPFEGRMLLDVAAGVGTRQLRLSPPDDCHPVLGDVMRLCWEWEPKDRVTMLQARQVVGVAYDEICHEAGSFGLIL